MTLSLRVLTLVLTVAIEKGAFRLRDGTGRIGKSDLSAQGLAGLFRQVAFEPQNPNHILMCSSSIDFPEDDGAPEGFDGRAAVREACSLVEQQTSAT